MTPCNLSGDGVSLYGPVSLDGSPYSVQVDNGPTSTFNAQKEFYMPQRLLYHASSLGPGAHTLNLTCQPVVLRNICAIDYAIVFTTTAPSLSTPVPTQKECVNGTVTLVIQVLNTLEADVITKSSQGIATEPNDSPS